MNTFNYYFLLAIIKKKRQFFIGFLVGETIKVAMRTLKSFDNKAAGTKKNWKKEDGELKMVAFNSTIVNMAVKSKNLNYMYSVDCKYKI